MSKEEEAVTGMEHSSDAARAHGNKLWSLLKYACRQQVCKMRDFFFLANESLLL